MIGGLTPPVVPALFASRERATGSLLAAEEGRQAIAVMLPREDGTFGAEAPAWGRSRGCIHNLNDSAQQFLAWAAAAGGVSDLPFSAISDCTPWVCQLGCLLNKGWENTHSCAC